MKSKLNWVKQKLSEYFSLDYRSLALMRFGMGVIIILDLIDRSRSLIAHYTDTGVLTRADNITLVGNKFYISLHMISGLPSVEIALFVIAGIFAVMLMVGYRTTLATIVSWILLLSLQERNTMVNQGADVIFRGILFWMMFLPTGKRWSLDRLFNRTPSAKKMTVMSGATLAYIVQIVLVYVMSGTLKTGAAWHDGTAVYYALSVDQLTRPLGEWLRTFEGMTTFLTHVTVIMETYGSLLFFSPIKTGLIRTIGIILFALLQIGFNLSMHLGLFGAIMIVGSFGLLPSYFWDSWWVSVRRFFSTRATKGLSIYYDTNCGFCYKTVFILKNFLFLSNETKTAPSDVDPAIAAVMERENSWVVINKDGKMFLGFDGVAEVFGYSPIFAWMKYILRLPIIRDVGEYFYRGVAEKRLAVCLPEIEETPQPNKLRTAGKYVGTGVLIFLTAYIIVWNVDQTDASGLLENISWIGWTAGLDQQFGMFAPTPLIEDGWYVIPGTLRGGQQIDLFKDGPMLTGKTFFPVSWDKPKDVGNTYPDQRWQKYLMNIAESANSRYRAGYAKYLCRTWNKTHTGDETLDALDLTFMIERTAPPGSRGTAPTKTNLLSYTCFGAPTEVPPTPPNPPTTL